MRTFFFALLPFAWGTIPASAAPTSPIDLRTAVDQALDNSPEIQKAEEKVNQLRFDKYTLRSGLLPKVDIEAKATHQKDSVANRTSVPFNGNAYNVYNVAIKGEQTLLRYGSFAAVSAADYEREMAVTDLVIARRELTKKLITAFYQTLMNQQLIGILDEQDKDLGEILGTARRRLSLGGKRIDVLQVQTQQALLKPKREKARSELASSTAELANLMGVSDQNSLSLHGKLVSLTVQNVEKGLNLQEFDFPELSKLRLKRQQIVQNKSVTLGKSLPSLKLTGDYNFANYTKADLFQAGSNSWSVQLVAAIPIFSGLSSFFERQSLNSQEEQVELEEQDTVNDLQLAQIKSRKGLEFAEASLASAEEADRLADESLKEAQREYRFGIIDFLQFMQVQQADFEAATSLMQLRLDAINAYTNYFAASGQPLTGLVDMLVKEENKP